MQLINCGIDGSPVWVELPQDLGSIEHLPTKNAIQKALDNGAEIKEIEEISAAPRPDWAEFRQNAIASRTWIRISSQNLRSLKLATSIEDCLWRVEERPELMSQVTNLWEVLREESQPTEAELAELRGFAEAANLPEVFRNLLI
jgi:hypothetical protein